MNIALSFNKKYIKYAIVMMTSVCINNTDNIDFYILHSELDGDDYELICNSIRKYDAQAFLLPVDMKECQEKLPVSDFWSYEIYYRLLLTELLPQSVDRILYLDVDIIVHGSLEELYNIDFEGMDLCVCDDCNGTLRIEDMSDYQQKIFAESIENGYRYFNSGVMLLNIIELKKRISFATYLDAIKELNYEISAPDQDILNYVHRGKIKYTDWKKYDLFARTAYNMGLSYDEMLSENIIIHFAGNKPWDCKGIHYSFEKIWWDYAKNTDIKELLMEEFIESAMSEATVENEIKRLQGECEQLREALSKAYSLMERICK